jgi:hypothetical protein
MYPLTIDLILQVVRLDVRHGRPKGLDKPHSGFFFDAEDVPHKKLNSWRQRRRSYMSYKALGALGAAQGIAVGEE